MKLSDTYSCIRECILGIVTDIIHNYSSSRYACTVPEKVFHRRTISKVSTNKRSRPEVLQMF